MIEEYKLEKSIWTQDDFEKMGWHDNSVYGFIFEEGEEVWSTHLLFDIDYIFKWVHPIPPKELFTFWVSPCTLKFKDVFDLIIDIDNRGGFIGLLDIYDIHLVSKIENRNNAFDYQWDIELQNGSIKFKSSGFEQFVRKSPKHVEGQALSIEEREGISFDKIEKL